MNKIEEIIKVAQIGGYPDQLALISTYKGIDDKLLLFAFRRAILDPKFFQAIGKAQWNKNRKWVERVSCPDKMEGCLVCHYKFKWEEHALEFHRINLSDPIKGWDDAINYLYELIK